MIADLNYQNIFKSFSKQKILIIGDVMVDSYIWGKVDRISPEAPVPVVVVNKRENRPGGAANVALNILALGAEPILCSVIGNDAKGDELLDIFGELAITDKGIYRSENRITTTKFRIIGNNMQMLRVDDETTESLNEEENEIFISKIESILNQNRIGCIVFQDYDKGVITPKLIDRITSMANEMNIPTAVDPKKRNFCNYKNVSLFKPNLKELREGMETEIDPANIEDITTAIDKLHDTQNIRMVLTTLSDKGVLISYNSKNEQRKNHHIPAHLRYIADVSGAGDTVIGAAAMCLALDMKPYDLAYISNLAGGLVCEHVGVVPIDKKRLLKELKLAKYKINNDI